MKPLLISLGIVLGLFALAGAISLIPMLMNWDKLSSYDTGLLGGRVVITLFLAIGSISLLKKAIRPDAASGNNDVST